MKKVFISCMFLLLPAVVIVAGTSGCSREPVRSTVSGTVTLNDKPVTAGSVRFFNKETEFGALCPLDGSGKYSFASPIPVGEYLVCITDPPSPQPGGMAPTQASKTPKVTVPPKYRSLDTSGLKFTITEGPNVYDMKLE